ncbi:MAG: hypothetical protein QG656_247, partial [Candidatus Hydrogenedentes bacterium]|nr:hypothetical protein [Candidatus Hydrogenedentota bacterium]
MDVETKEYRLAPELRCYHGIAAA